MAFLTRRKYGKMTERFVADTSLLINFFNGHPVAITCMEDRDIWISGVTEIEVLSSAKLSLKEKKLIPGIQDCRGRKRIVEMKFLKGFCYLQTILAGNLSCHHSQQTQPPS